MAENAPPTRLTDRQQRFVEEYLVDLNPGAAAVRAGYGVKSAPSVGRKLRRQPLVGAAVEAAMARRGERLRITQDRVVAELARIAFADIRDFVAWDEAGVTLRASRELGPEQTACVAEIVESPGKTGKGLRIKLHGKTQALAALSRHLGSAGPGGRPGPVGPDGKDAPAHGPRPLIVVTCVPEPDPPPDEDSSGDGPVPCSGRKEPWQPAQTAGSGRPYKGALVAGPAGAPGRGDGAEAGSRPAWATRQ